MAERSFAREVQDLRLSAGQEFRGEGILAVTKALLQAGVGYVAGYQGAPISHLMDVLADAQDILSDLGVHFEASASEAAAASTLATSVNYPIRGAVTWKSTAGTNVASDALSNLSSGGVTGGAVIIIGEDYGEGSSIMQERTHAFAMKSQIWLLDPRPNLPSIVRAVEDAFELSEASNTPVMLELRIRACHVHGSFIAKDNVRPKFTLNEALEQPRQDLSRIVLPPSSFIHEQEKVKKRWPAAVDFIRARGMNETFAGDVEDIGIVLQGGMYNSVMRALALFGLADVWGGTRIPLHVLNVTYPLVDADLAAFCRGKRAVLMVEEGQPEFLETALHAILRKAGVDTAVAGKDVLPMGGEYTAQVLVEGLRKFLDRYEPSLLREARKPPSPGAGAGRPEGDGAGAGGAAASAELLHRLPGAADLLGDDAGAEGTRLRTTSPATSAATCSASTRRSISARRQWVTGWAPSSAAALQVGAKQAADRGDGRWRVLAQRAGHRRQQRGVQQA